MKRRRQWHPTPVLLPGKSHGWRSLVGYSPWGSWESDTTERLHFHFSLSCIGGGNGNPLQCSCLEDPRDGRAWWLPSVGSHRVRHDWSNLAAATAAELRCNCLPASVFEYLMKISSIIRSKTKSFVFLQTCLSPSVFSLKEQYLLLLKSQIEEFLLLLSKMFLP